MTGLLCTFKNTFFCLLLIGMGCRNTEAQKNHEDLSDAPEASVLGEIVVAANRTELYLPLLSGKKVAVVANQTSVIFKQAQDQTGEIEFTHLVDSLLALNVAIQKVFAPEHGFRGEADAGEKVADGTDAQTGLPLISLYGKNRKPAQEHLQDIDLVLFDIQDVGVRFYTYIATLQLVMEACAEAGIPVLVLDRPNPNGSFVDGPVMEDEHTGFLGMTPIPLVYGMTIGEYAEMINQEGWLEGSKKADLTLIPLERYSHDRTYQLPIRPSPNLPNDQAITLYPSLGLFEGTNINAGRGTNYQFQQFGASFLDSLYFTYTYTPEPNFGAKYPKEQGKRCFGKDLRRIDPPRKVDLSWLLEAYRNCPEKEKFFITDGFTRHAGTRKLQKDIENGKTLAEISESWKADLEEFQNIRKKYLRYD